MSGMGQLAVELGVSMHSVSSKIGILRAEVDGEDGVIVTFSDGTIGAYVAEELLELRPIRERVDEQDERGSSHAWDVAS